MQGDRPIRIQCGPAQKGRFLAWAMRYRAEAQRRFEEDCRRLGYQVPLPDLDGGQLFPGRDRFFVMLGQALLGEDRLPRERLLGRLVEAYARRPVEVEAAAASCVAARRRWILAAYRQRGGAGR